MKVAVYNRFLQSMGGGERHSSMLAQVLADDGHEVDLVGHKDVGKEILADHLGLNLGKVNLRIVPDRGEPQVGDLSASYELFVNASYMSRVKAQAAHNLYLCYFPTPFDHDLAGWQRRLVRLLGGQVRQDVGPFEATFALTPSVSGGTDVPSGAMALGVPARIKPDAVDPDLMIRFPMLSYVERGKRYRDGLRRLD